MNFTGENWRRYAADNSNKETSLKILAKHLRIDLGDVVAFGDDINDLGMLKISGTAVADHITESNDQDGVAKFLERTLLA